MEGLLVGAGCAAGPAEELAAGVDLWIDGIIKVSICKACIITLAVTGAERGAATLLGAAR